MSMHAYAALDEGARARIESACAFVNNKISRARERVYLVGGAAAAVAVLWLITTGVDPWLPLGLFLVATGAAVSHGRRDVARWYKMLVIRRVVDALGEGLSYSPRSSFTRDAFQRLDMFSRVDDWTSEDEISGTHMGVRFALHEVRASREERRGKSTVTVPVFYGLMLMLDFNKHFAGHTVIVPDAEGRRLGGLLGEATSRNGKRIARLADPEFEKLFTAYSTDDQEAHYILTPRFMELVRRARRATGEELRFAFHGSSLFVAVPSTNEWFEASLWGKANSWAAIDDLAGVLKLAQQLVDALDLRTRIWSKA